MDLDHDINFDDDNIVQIVNKNIFFETMFANYKTDRVAQTNILKQTLLDFKRQDVYINGVKTDDIFVFLCYVYREMALHRPAVYNEILQMSQQTALSSPFSLIATKVFPKIVSEIPEGKGQQIYLTDRSVTTEKLLRIVNCESADVTNLSKLKIVIVYDIESELVTITYNLTKYNDNKNYDNIEELHGFEKIY